MRGALVAGEVLTTATADDAEGTAPIEENAETAAPAEQEPLAARRERSRR